MSTITKTVLSDGPTKAVISYTFAQETNDSELVNYVLLDPAVDLQPVVGKLSLLQVWYGFSQFDGMLAFDDLVPNPCWQLIGVADSYSDLRYFAGLRDRSGPDRTGKLLLTTKGFANDGAFGTLVIEVRKN